MDSVYQITNIQKKKQLNGDKSQNFAAKWRHIQY